MKEYKIILGTILSAIVCFSSINVEAAETLNLNLEKAIELAIETSESIKMKDNNLSIRKEQIKGAKSALYPKIESVTSWTANTEYANTGLVDDYDVESGFTVDQLLYAFGRVSSAVKSAQKYLSISDYEKLAAKRNVVYDSKIAYFAALLAQKTHEIVTQSYENAVANKKILEDRSATGRVSKKDNIKISSDVATRQPIMYNALVTMKTSMNTLGRIIGVGSKPIVLTSSFDLDHNEMDIDQYKQKLLSHEPALKALSETVDLNENLVQIKKAAFYPEINAFGTWTYKGSDGQADVAREAVDQYGTVGIKVTVPIWNGGERFAELKAARFEKDNAELEFEKYKNDLILELEIAMNEYRGFVEALASYQESVRLAEESFKASQDLFASGQISTTDLNDAELTLTNERLNLEKTKYYINISLAQIERLTSEGQI